MNTCNDSSSILVVDDLPENLEAMEALLLPHNYTIHKALSGEEALKTLLKVKVDLVLMDVCMPAINGIQTASLIRKHRKFSDLPIIFVTAVSQDKEIIKEAYSLDAIDFICKPVDSDTLLSKVGVFLSMLKKRERVIEQERRQKDIIKSHAVELNSITSQIEEVKNALDEFTYIASHDLREPLRGINNYARFIFEDYQEILPDDANSKLKTIMELAERQDVQIDALLEYSRIGRTEERCESFDLHSTIDAVKVDLCSLIEKENAEIVIESDLPVLNGCPSTISRIFYNLTANGIKYNASDKKRISIHYNPTSETFTVSDNGIGIPEKHISSVFKIFKRLHKGKKQSKEGTGAGLTIVKKIVESYNGKIWLESQENQGSQFHFTLPEANPQMANNNSNVA